MSRNQRSAERRRANEAAYEAEYEARQAKEAAFRRRFGPLEDRLEALGIEPFELAAYLAAKIPEHEPDPDCSCHAAGPSSP